MKTRWNKTVKKQKEKLDEQMAEYDGTRELFKKFIDIRKATEYKARWRDGACRDFLYHMGDNELIFWTMLDHQLTTQSPKFNVSEYIKFRTTQQQAEKKGWKWQPYSVRAWIKQKIKTL